MRAASRSAAVVVAKALEVRRTTSPMRIAFILGSNFGGIGVAGIWGLLLIVASLAAALALALAAFRRTRRAGVWISSLALLAGLALLGFYFGLLRDQHPDWIVMPMSVAPGVASALALFCALKGPRDSRKDAAAPPGTN